MMPHPSGMISISEDFRKKDEIKIRFEENKVKTECNPTVKELKVAAWHIANNSTTEKMTTAGFLKVEVVLNDSDSDCYLLQQDSVKEMEPYRSYTFQGLIFSAFPQRSVNSAR
ncbi:uncharacterized protein DFL_004533 [Arthrobotrys flagrans]|uniref:Uncharacterized protein n=1 Tax=Arthrobotrys flagrans TaxID=97331 RepID=A0A437A561_ARTFL|nr:hypothetical protein DFL_004533 [Arthrobotrys flagrans]